MSRKEFGVDYVVEGSVRKAADRVRVTVQLIDGETETHVWAERYDRKLEDIFAIQDEVTSAIVATLRGRVEAATHERAKRKPTENMAAYEYVLTGKVLHHWSAREANAEALRMLDRAIELDPKYAHAHAWKACVHRPELGARLVRGHGCDAGDRSATSCRSRSRSTTTTPTCTASSRRSTSTSTNHDKAAYHQERALSLNPNNDLIVVQQGELLTWLGRPEEGIEWIRKAMRLNPYHPERFWNHLGRAQFVARRLCRCDRVLQPHHRARPHPSRLPGGRLGADGRQDRRRGACARGARARRPPLRSQSYLATLHYKQEADREHHREGLAQGRPAGLNLRRRENASGGRQDAERRRRP